ncbi:hypothetical protein YPPY60_4468, partial [Yersinia pestis PY-60]
MDASEKRAWAGMPIALARQPERRRRFTRRAIFRAS